jgi:hypothetical protein
MKTIAPLLFAVLTSASIFSTAHADEQAISVPGEGWRIRFNAPRMTPFDNSQEPGVFSGMADRMRLSFAVEQPHCTGPDSDENIYNCFAGSLEKNPNVVWDSEQGNVAKNGVHVTYFSERDRENGTGRVLNVNLLFARNGKWANVHLSMNAPRKEDVNTLFDVVDSVVVEDEPMATADAQ